MEKVIYLISLTFLMFGCNSDSSINIQDNRSEDVKSTLVSTDLTQKELKASLEKIRKQEAEKERIRKESMTAISFDRISHDFGNVDPGVENTTTFIVKNSGNKPLIIENVEASCGCTTPVKPTKPILPGQTDKITVSFKSNPGQTGKQHKTVTVTSNTPEKTHKLEIIAFVK